jgi:hypothetical protein
MTDLPKVGGYIWNDRLKHGLRSNEDARRNLARVVQLLGNGDARLHRYLTKLALALAEEQSAWNTLQTISNDHERKN